MICSLAHNRRERRCPGRPAWYLLTLTFLCWSPWGHAAAASNQACIVLPAVAAGEETFLIYLEALRIETRKAGARWNWILVERAGGCTSGQPILSLSGHRRASLARPSGGRHEFDLETMPQEVRARTLAQAVIRQLHREPIAPVPLLTPEDAITLGRVAPEPVKPSSGTKWLARVGGTYMYQFGADLHLGGLTLETGVSFYQDRLAISLVGSYAWAGDVDADGTVLGLQCGGLLAMVRGGLRWDVILLRGGIGVGWQRRRVSAELDPGSDCYDTCVKGGGDAAGCRTRCYGSTAPGRQSVAESSDAVVTAVDVEFVWSFAHRWSASLLFGAQIYFAGSEHTVSGRTIYGQVPAALGGQLALGVSL